MRKNDTYVILLVTNQSGCDYSFLATIGFIAPDKKMINSRHTGMIIWIIKILRRLHDTFYKQNVLSLAFRQRVGIISKTLKTRIYTGFLRIKKSSWQRFGNIWKLFIWPNYYSCNSEGSTSCWSSCFRKRHYRTIKLLS